MLSLGNYGTGVAGGVAARGLPVLAHRCPEFKWEQLLRLDCPRPPPTRGRPWPPAAGWGAGGARGSDFSEAHSFRLFPFTPPLGVVEAQLTFGDLLSPNGHGFLSLSLSLCHRSEPPLSVPSDHW